MALLLNLLRGKQCNAHVAIAWLLAIVIMNCHILLQGMDSLDRHCCPFYRSDSAIIFHVPMSCCAVVCPCGFWSSYASSTINHSLQFFPFPFLSDDVTKHQVYISIFYCTECRFFVLFMSAYELLYSWHAQSSLCIIDTTSRTRPVSVDFFVSAPYINVDRVHM